MQKTCWKILKWFWRHTNQSGMDARDKQSGKKKDFVTLSFIFCLQKLNFDSTRRIVELFWVKTRENAAVLDYFTVDNFDFTGKIVKKNLGEKLVKMLGFCQN